MSFREREYIRVQILGVPEGDPGFWCCDRQHASMHTAAICVAKQPLGTEWEFRVVSRAFMGHRPWDEPYEKPPRDRYTGTVTQEQRNELRSRWPKQCAKTWKRIR